MSASSKTARAGLEGGRERREDRVIQTHESARSRLQEPGLEEGRKFSGKEKGRKSPKLESSPVASQQEPGLRKAEEEKDKTHKDGDTQRASS